jgi:hypothetical protein
MDELSRKPPRAKKAASLTMRITQGTRDALEAAAKEEGRSVSEVAERWIIEAQRGRAAYRELIGGTGVSEAIDALLAVAREIETEVGDPRTSLLARDALRAGWNHIFDRALPFTPDSPEGRKLRARRMEIAEACEKSLGAMQAAPQEVRSLLYPAPKPQGILSMGAAGAAEGYRSIAGKSAYEVLMACHDNVMPHTVEEVQRLVEFAGAEPSWAAVYELLAEARAAIPGYNELYFGYMRPRSAAAKRGRAIAESVAGVPVLPHALG